MAKDEGFKKTRQESGQLGGKEGTKKFGKEELTQKKGAEYIEKGRSGFSKIGQKSRELGQKTKEGMGKFGKEKYGKDELLHKKDERNK